ncbi:MAG: hypothetical protein KKC75_00375 [Nanoarchaeota archaeon]|nr:hypothetical protein [Nanoarchaeota archaeon]MBU1005559.1 hypothetical protein [Nanoarchaeota archaeon]MBU1945951.1 hypothetical protein [Nanoarchaeota archaeon]
METQLIVTLSPYLQPDIGEGVLVRVVNREHLNSPVRDLVYELLNPKADEYNPAYNTEDRLLAEVVRSWFAEMGADPVRAVVRLCAFPFNDDQAIPLELDKRVSDYAKRIMQAKSLPGASFASRYDLIDLGVAVSYCNPC